VREALEQHGLAVRVLPESAVLPDRTRAAVGADLLVSIHHDSVLEERMADADRYRGFSLFVSRRNPKFEKSLACASVIGAELRAAGRAPSRYHAEPIPGENRPFADEPNGVHYFDELIMMRTAAMPAVLIEAGVIVNRREEAEMSDAAVRRRIAEAIAKGAQTCLP
jgi:N-acetylmuramoyl-L-alanine amidase